MRNIPDNNLAYPVFIKLDNGGTGSGFLLATNDKVYLTTAKHVIYDQKTSMVHWKTAELLCQNDNLKSDQVFKFKMDFKKLADKGKIIVHHEADVCVIQIFETILDESNPAFGRLNLIEGVTELMSSTEGDFITVALSSVISLDDVLISNDIYLYGYPTSLGLANNQQFNITKPLLRKGIVAGVNNLNSTIILDCPVYFGNSGGPVVQVENLNNGTFSHKIIGLVSEYVPFQENWINSRNGAINTYISNSGYSIAVSMDKVLETLKIPIGEIKN